MPDFKAPGVYVEETTVRSRSIAGVSTSTTAFVGPTLTAPRSQDSTPDELLVTSFAGFEQKFGGVEDLPGDGNPVCNYVAHSAHAYFNNGGKRLYIARVEPDASAADYIAAMEALRQITDICLIAAPGYSARADEVEIQQALIDHVERAGHQDRYRFAVLDSPPAATIDEVLAVRAGIDTAHAAIYYPWVTIDNPLAVTDPNQPGELQLPPSGFVCGIFARVDAARGVWKAPTNEALRDARGLQRQVSDLEQRRLNDKGVNCIRSSTGHGILLWGARTASSDPEWKYINIRRYILYLEQSITEGTRWTVFEPNDEKLWVNVLRAIEDFLMNEWRGGALAGVKAEEAFFVRCDRTTMTQNDIDNGHLIAEIGIAPLKPAEFVIIRIGHWAAASHADRDEAGDLLKLPHRPP